VGKKVNKEKGRGGPGARTLKKKGMLPNKFDFVEKKLLLGAPDHAEKKIVGRWQRAPRKGDKPNHASNKTKGRKKGQRWGRKKKAQDTGMGKEEKRRKKRRRLWGIRKTLTGVWRKGF